MQQNGTKMTIYDYIEAHTTPPDARLDRIERETYWQQINPRMVCGAVEGRFLAAISRMIKPKRVLEIGTFTGYSTLCLVEGLQADGTLITIERDDEREEVIRTNTAHEPRIKLLIGDAIPIMQAMQEEEKRAGGFDLVFIDGDKRQYPDYLEAVLPLMHEDSWLIADNTLWSDHVIDPKYDNEPQTRALKRFNDMVMEIPELTSIILPLRDGISLCHFGRR